MKRIALLTIFLLLGLTSCSDYWRDAGHANVTKAQAALQEAQAAQGNAEAAIIAAEGARALDQAQAAALGESVRANSDMAQAALRAAIDASDNTEMWLLLLVVCAVAIASVAAIGVAAIRAQRAQPVIVQPAPAPMPAPGLWIATPAGEIMLLPEPGETRGAFLIRARDTADLLGGGRLLPPGRER